MNAVILEKLSKIYSGGKTAVDTVSLSDFRRGLRLSRSQRCRKNDHSKTLKRNADPLLGELPDLRDRSRPDAEKSHAISGVVAAR